MSVVRDFCGHGVGRVFHDEPNIVHVGRPGEGIVLKPGMFFTVEPMINLGRPHVKVLSDGWTAVTRDRSLSAQFEHSVGVTETGVEIFTLSPEGLYEAALSSLSRRRHDAASGSCVGSSAVTSSFNQTARGLNRGCVQHFGCATAEDHSLRWKRRTVAAGGNHVFLSAHAISRRCCELAMIARRNPIAK